MALIKPKNADIVYITDILYSLYNIIIAYITHIIKLIFKAYKKTDKILFSIWTYK